MSNNTHIKTVKETYSFDGRKYEFEYRVYTVAEPGVLINKKVVLQVYHIKKLWGLVPYKKTVDLTSERTSATGVNETISDLARKAEQIVADYTRAVNSLSD